MTKKILTCRIDVGDIQTNRIAPTSIESPNRLIGANVFSERRVANQFSELSQTDYPFKLSGESLWRLEVDFLLVSSNLQNS